MTQTIIFDFDMTLVDSIQAITRGLGKIAARFNLRPVGEDEVRKVISLESKAFWSALWGRYDEAWSRYFVDEVSREEKIYLEVVPGAEELLADLKKAGNRLALATNRDDAWQALYDAKLDAYFEAAAGCMDVPCGKPAPDMIFLLLEQMGADPDGAVFIGDSTSDMEAAKEAGVRGIGLVWGAGEDREKLLRAGAWRVADKLAELRPLLGL